MKFYSSSSIIKHYEQNIERWRAELTKLNVLIALQVEADENQTPVNNRTKQKH